MCDDSATVPSEYIIALFPISENDSCVSPFTLVGSSCLYISDNLMLWPAARDYCVSIQGHLVMVKTQTKQQEIDNFMQGMCTRDKVQFAFYMHFQQQSAHWAVDVTAQVVPCGLGS